MIRRSYFAAMLGLSLCCGHTASASAQQRDGPDTFYAYARNKIGLLHYCRDKALLGQVTADRAAESIALALERLAVSDDLVKEWGDRAEKAGRAGFWEEANNRRDLASVAGIFGTTTAGLCKELAGQTRTVQQPPATRQVAAKVATSGQAGLNTNRSTTSVRPASRRAASPKAVTPAPAAGSGSAIECEGNFQVQKNGNQIATPYCQDDYLAIVAREYGMRVTGKDIRQGHDERQRACNLAGEDNRVRDACSQYRQFRRARR